MPNKENNENGFATRSIHSSVRHDHATDTILTPIYQTTTFVQDGFGRLKGYTYSRSANPTVSALEEKIGALDGMKRAVCFSTGMAATTTKI